MSRIWMSHVPHMNKSCHTFQWVMSHISMSHVTHINESCHTYEWVMSHTWLSHVTHMNESCHTYEWVMSHMWMSHVTHINESCHTYEWVVSHLWMSHVTHINESCHTYEWVMSHIWMSHVTHMNESCHTYEWVMSHIWITCKRHEILQIPRIFFCDTKIHLIFFLISLPPLFCPPSPHQNDAPWHHPKFSYIFLNLFIFPLIFFFLTLKRRRSMSLSKFIEYTGIFLFPPSSPPFPPHLTKATLHEIIQICFRNMCRFHVLDTLRLRGAASWMFFLQKKCLVHRHLDILRLEGPCPVESFFHKQLCVLFMSSIFWDSEGPGRGGTKHGKLRRCKVPPTCKNFWKPSCIVTFT